MFVHVCVCGWRIVENVLGLELKGDNNELFSFFISEILVRIRRYKMTWFKRERIKRFNILTKLRG